MSTIQDTTNPDHHTFTTPPAHSYQAQAQAQSQAQAQAQTQTQDYQHQHDLHDDSEDHPSPDSDQEQDQESRTNEARTAFTASLNAIGQNYDQPLRARAETLHEMETILRGQEEQVSSATAGLSRQNAEMEGTLDTAREGLKEIGDVQNWAELLERDLLVVEEVLRDVEGRDYDSDVDADADAGVDTSAAGDTSASASGSASGGNGGRNDSGSGDNERVDGTRATDGKKGWFKWW